MNARQFGGPDLKYHVATHHIMKLAGEVMPSFPPRTPVLGGGISHFLFHMYEQIYEAVTKYYTYQGSFHLIAE